LRDNLCSKKLQSIKNDELRDAMECRAQIKVQGLSKQYLCIAFKMVRTYSIQEQKIYKLKKILKKKKKKLDEMEDRCLLDL